MKPEPDEVYYVYDTDPSEANIPLGYHEKYYAGAFAENAEKMVRGEWIEPIMSNEEFGWLMSVYYPLWTSDGRSAGYVGVDIEMTEVRKDLSSFALNSLLIGLLLAFLFSSVFIYITEKKIASPIRTLSHAAMRLVEEEHSGETAGTSIFQNLTIRSNDEIGALYESLAQMEQDINDYITNLVSVTSEKERISTELNVATQIQADMLPRLFPAFPDRNEFDIYASMTPAREVGGDFYDFFLLDRDHLGLVMADVSGKGVPAALFMVISRTLIKNRAQMGGDPAEILSDVNDRLCEGNEANLFVTVWLAILNLRTGRGLAANAGHEHPAIRRRDGRFELVVYRHSPAVATLEDIEFREHEFYMEPGDTLFVYTDGVTEATNAKYELFGSDRMLEALNDDPDASPEELLMHVKKEIDDFVGDAPQFDDVTMMALRYDGPQAVRDTLRITALISNLDEVLAFADRHLEEAGCLPRIQMTLDIAIEEIFVNIAHYAYEPETGDAEISITIDGDPAEAVIEFRDRGIPFDPLAKEDPDVTLPAEERRIGGLGIFMVKKSMDGMEYRREDGQNILTIRKVLV